MKLELFNNSKSLQFKEGEATILGNKVIRTLFDTGSDFPKFPDIHKPITSHKEEDYILTFMKNGDCLITIAEKDYLIKPNWLQKRLLEIYKQKLWIYEKSFITKFFFILLGGLIGWLLRYISESC